MAEYFFTTALFLVFYAYFGYPLSLGLISRLFGSRDVKRGAHTPPVTLIITAHNESMRIRQKLENTLRLHYAKEKMQVIVASDGSIDDTNQIIKEFASEGIQLLEITQRGGKENAQKAAVGQAMAEILIFTDAATLLAPDAVEKIVRNFADPSVGSVSSEDRLIGLDGKPAGEGMYLRYEMWLRRLESRVGSLVGLSGSFFAARKEVCQDFSGDMQSDFRTVLNTVRMGLRAVAEPQAIGYYQDVADEKLEFERKVRTVLRGLTVYFKHLRYLNALKYGLFSYLYLCHKLFRWLVPGFLCLAFVSNSFLATESFLYFSTLVLQIAFYCAALYGWRRGSGSLGGLARLPAYFVTVNLAILVAWARFLKGDRIVMWAPSKR